MIKQIETIIVGGGQGGLSTSYYLKKLGREHIILEQDSRVAETWRNRWDTFTLITPNWMIKLPGAEYQGVEPDAFTSRDKIVDYFEEYIKQFELPIIYRVHVNLVTAIKDGYLVSTDEKEYKAKNVVIAVGLNQKPKIPAFSSNLSKEIHQIHSSKYQNPESLSNGAVLVVGSAQSGVQIAEELYQSGRKVYLSVSRSGRFPRRYRGKDMTQWFDAMGLFDVTVDKLPSPRAKFAGSVHGTGKNGGHTINLHQFARDGVVLLGHIQSMDEKWIILQHDLKESLAIGDKWEADFLDQIDEYVKNSGLEAPIEILPKLLDGYEKDLILQLDLKSAGVTNVVWATGYSFDFNMIKILAFDEDGYPVQKRGVTEFQGLYFIGLPFLHTFKSGILAGVGYDAAYITDYIDSHTTS